MTSLKPYRTLPKGCWANAVVYGTETIMAATTATVEKLNASFKRLKAHAVNSGAVGAEADVIGGYAEAIVKGSNTLASRID